MAKVTKSTPKRKGFYARAEDDIDNPCCGKSKSDWKNPAEKPLEKKTPKKPSQL